MTEALPFKSAEKKYLLNAEAFEMRVHKFIEKPVDTLREIRKEFLDASEMYEDFDIVGETFILIDEYKEFMYEHNLISSNFNLRQYFTFGSYTDEGDTGLFTLFKEAGYEKEELKQWLKFGEHTMPPEDQFMVRQSLAIVERVYANN